ncbi:DUF4942 domain-containing protein [Microbulbifer aggregans]|uniref:DUF4942 domain-containing protein n=1 Tax=Microbulbifer aggregans TaxID=1769779 RepID=UPI001CFCB664|nr:DUF4942 domain-containing protein [Microbulbifer aggregans]
MTAITGNDPLPSPSLGFIDRTCRHRDQALALLESGMRDIWKAIELSPDRCLSEALRQRVSWYSLREPERECGRSIETLRVALDQGCWKELLQRSKLGLVMNARQLDQVRDEIAKSTQECTREVAMATFMDLVDRRYETFREGLVEVFKTLSRNYRSHSVFRVNKRIILDNALWGIGWNCYRQRDRFHDLWSYCCLLDGVDPTGFNPDETPAAQLTHHLKRGQREYVFEYFRVKTYENGNLHIWMDQRPDLLERINALIAEHYGTTLPQEKGR